MAICMKCGRSLDEQNIYCTCCGTLAPGKSPDISVELQVGKLDIVEPPEEKHPVLRVIGTPLLLIVMTAAIFFACFCAGVILESFSAISDDGDEIIESADSATEILPDTTAASASEIIPTQERQSGTTEPVTRSAVIDYYSAYAPLLEKYDRDTENDIVRYYGLFDFDGDGCQELIAEYGNGEAVRKAEIWDLSHTYLGEVFTAHSVWETKDGVLYLNMGHMGYQSVSRVELRNKTIETTEIYNSGDQMLEDYASYGKALPVYDFADPTGLLPDSGGVKEKALLKPSAEISIEVEPPPAGADGDTLYLCVKGNYSYYEYDVYIGNEPGNYEDSTHGTSAESRMRVTAGSVPLYVYAIVTPVSASGEVGDAVKTTGTNYRPSDVISGSPESCFLWGEINTHGGVVASFTTSYVVDGGAPSHVRDELGNGWHVDAKRKCISRGIRWYELYDSDDGDYYGWVDAAFIDFYAGG